MEVSRSCSCPDWISHALQEFKKEAGLSKQDLDQDQLHPVVKRNYATLEEGLEDLLKRAKEDGKEVKATASNLQIKFAADDSSDMFSSDSGLSLFDDNASLPEHIEYTVQDKEKLQQEIEHIKSKIQDNKGKPIEIAYHNKLTKAIEKLKTIEETLVHQGIEVPIQIEHIKSLLNKYSVLKRTVQSLSEKNSRTFKLLKIEEDDKEARQLLDYYVEKKSICEKIIDRLQNSKSKITQRAFLFYLKKGLDEDLEALPLTEEFEVDGESATIKEVLRYYWAIGVISSEAEVDRLNDEISDLKKEIDSLMDSSEVKAFFETGSSRAKSEEYRILSLKKKVRLIVPPRDFKNIDPETDKEYSRLLSLAKFYNIEDLPDQQRSEVMKSRSQDSVVEDFMKSFKMDFKPILKKIERAEKISVEELNKSLKESISRILLQGRIQGEVPDIADESFISDEGINRKTLYSKVESVIRNMLTSAGVIGEFTFKYPKWKEVNLIGEMKNVKPAAVEPNVPLVSLPKDVNSLHASDKKKIIHQCPDYKKTISYITCHQRSFKCEACKQDISMQDLSKSLLKTENQEETGTFDEETVLNTTICPKCSSENSLIPVRCPNFLYAVNSDVGKDVACRRRIEKLSFVNSPRLYVTARVWKIIFGKGQNRLFVDLEELLKFFGDNYETSDKIVKKDKKESTITREYISRPGQKRDGNTFEKDKIYLVKQKYKIVMQNGKIISETPIVGEGTGTQRQLIACIVKNPHYIHSMLHRLHTDVMLEGFEIPEEQFVTKDIEGIDRESKDLFKFPFADNKGTQTADDYYIPKKFKTINFDKEQYICACDQFIGYAQSELQENESYKDKVIRDFNTLKKIGKRKYSGLNLEDDGSCPECGASIAKIVNDKIVDVNISIYDLNKNDSIDVLQIIPSYIQRIRYVAYGYVRCKGCNKRYFDKSNGDYKKIAGNISGDMAPRGNCPYCGYTHCTKCGLDHVDKSNGKEPLCPYCKNQDSSTWTPEIKELIEKKSKEQSSKIANKIDIKNYFKYMGRLKEGSNGNLSIMQPYGVERLLRSLKETIQNWATQNEELRKGFLGKVETGEIITRFIMSRVAGWDIPGKYGTSPKTMYRRDEFYIPRHLYSCKKCGNKSVYMPSSGKCEINVIDPNTKKPTTCNGSLSLISAFRCNNPSCMEPLDIHLAFKRSGDLQCPHHDCRSLIVLEPWLRNLNKDWKCSNRNCKKHIPLRKIIDAIQRGEDIVYCGSCNYIISVSKLLESVSNASCPTCSKTIWFKPTEDQLISDITTMIENSSTTICPACGIALKPIQRIGKNAKPLDDNNVTESSIAEEDFLAATGLNQSLFDDDAEKIETHSTKEVEEEKTGPVTIEEMTSYTELTNNYDGVPELVDFASIITEEEGDELEKKSKTELTKNLGKDLEEVTEKLKINNTPVDCHFWPKFNDTVGGFNPGDINQSTRPRTVEKCLDCEKEGKQTLFTELENGQYVIFGWKSAEGSSPYKESKENSNEDIEYSDQNILSTIEDLISKKSLEKPLISLEEGKEVSRKDVPVLQTDTVVSKIRKRVKDINNSMKSLQEQVSTTGDVEANKKLEELKKEKESLKKQFNDIKKMKDVSLITSVAIETKKLHNGSGRCPISNHDNITTVGRPRKINSSGTCMACIVPECKFNIITRMIEALMFKEGWTLGYTEAEVVVTKLGPAIINKMIKVGNKCPHCKAYIGNINSDECPNCVSADAVRVKKENPEVDTHLFSENELVDSNLFDDTTENVLETTRSTGRKSVTELPSKGTREELIKQIPKGSAISEYSHYTELLEDREAIEEALSEMHLMPEDEYLALEAEVSKTIPNISKLENMASKAKQIVESGDTNHPKYQSAVLILENLKQINIYNEEVKKRTEAMGLKSELGRIDVTIQQLFDSFKNIKRFRQQHLTSLQENMQSLVEIQSKIENYGLIKQIDDLEIKYQETKDESIKEKIKELEKELSDWKKSDEYKELKKQFAPEIKRLNTEIQKQRKTVYQFKDNTMRLIKVAERSRKNNSVSARFAVSCLESIN